MKRLLIIFLTLGFIGACDSTKRDWDKANSENTIAAYETFLKNHPERPLSDEVRNRIEILYMEQARSINNVFTYTNYLGRYPAGKFADEARLKIYEFLKNERLTLFRNIKKVKLITHESYGKEENVPPLPFYRITKQLLGYAGFIVVGNDAIEYDATLEINAESKILGASYIRTIAPSIPTPDPAANPSFRYTGASVSGEISIIIPGSSAYKKSFEGVKGPIGPIRDIEGQRRSYSTPSDAPLYAAFRDYFLPKLFEMIVGISGPSPLIIAMKIDPDAEAGRLGDMDMMAWELGNIKDPRAIEPLITALGDEEPKVREGAARALGNFIDPRVVQPLITALKDDNSSVRGRAASALRGRKDSRVVDVLVVTLKDTKLSVRSDACNALQEVGEIAIGPLRPLLKDDNPDVRLQAVAALGGIKSPRSVESLIDALKDKDPKVKKLAEEKLVEMGNIAVEPLIAALKSEDLEVKVEAMNVLRDVKDARVVKPLIVALKDNDHKVRKAAASALSSLAIWDIEKSSMIAPLITALKDSERDVRRAVAKGLGHIKDSRVVEPLIGALKDKDPKVRDEAVSAFWNIKDARAVEPVIAVLKDEDPNVRRTAVVALGYLKDPRAVEPLLVILKYNDQGLRAKAAWALGEIKDPRALEPLTATLKDKDWTVSEAARMALIIMKQ